MRYGLFAVAVLFFTGCGDVDDTSAPEYEEKVIDLRVEGSSHTVRVDGADEVAVIRRSGQRVPLSEWMAEIGDRHGIDLSDRIDPNSDELTITLGGAGDLERGHQERPEDDPSADLRETEAGTACPEDCLHCPEDNAFLCAQLCQ